MKNAKSEIIYWLFIIMSVVVILVQASEVMT